MRIAYEIFGEGETTIVFTPVDVIVHSRMWKAQVPYLARHFRVVTIDPRGTAARTARPTPRRTATWSTSPTPSR